MIKGQRVGPYKRRESRKKVVLSVPAWVDYLYRAEAAKMGRAINGHYVDVLTRRAWGLPGAENMTLPGEDV